jgi:hypothetical protein
VLPERVYDAVVAPEMLLHELPDDFVDTCHWYDSPPPVAAAWNATDEPAVTDTMPLTAAGVLEMVTTGVDTVTVRRADELVTEPRELVTVTVNRICGDADCAWSASVATPEYDEAVAPAMSTPLRYHWYVNAVPVATTLNVYVDRTATDLGAGCVVMLGGACSTVSVAASDSTEPAIVDTRHAIAMGDNAMSAVLVARFSTLLVWPAKFAPPRVHWYVTPTPDAAMLNVAVAPAVTVVDPGCVVITGGVTIVTVATALSTNPAVLLTLTLYDVVAAGVTVSDGSVAPDTAAPPLTDHWYCSPPPDAATVSTVDWPAAMATDDGCDEIAGTDATTDSVATRLSTLPATLDTRTWNDAVDASKSALVTVNDSVALLPETGMPLRLHWYVDAPVATTLNDAVAPTATVASAGCVVMLGGFAGPTVSVATPLTVVPPTLVTAHENWLPESESAATLEYDDDVAPAMSAPFTRHW